MDQSSASDKLVVLLTGPVGGGKTAAAEALAETLRNAGRRAAFIDLDLVYCMARQSDGFADEDVWRTARRGAAALADRFFEDGLDAVIVEGSFHNEQECGDVRAHLRCNAQTKVVALNVSYPETARRVEADPATDRIVSRDPHVLRYLHAQFVNALPFLETAGLVVHSDSLTPAQIAGTIAGTILK